MIFKHYDYAGQQQKYERSSTFFDYFWCGHQKKMYYRFLLLLFAKMPIQSVLLAAPFFPRKIFPKTLGKALRKSLQRIGSRNQSLAIAFWKKANKSSKNLKFSFEWFLQNITTHPRRETAFHIH